MYTNNHTISDLNIPVSSQGYPPPTEDDSVYICSGSWVGSNVTVLKGVTIGCISVVGAGSVVTRSIPPGEVWAGIPAKKISGIFNSISPVQIY